MSTMADQPSSTGPRNGGAEHDTSTGSNFRGWLRQALRGKSGEDWRATIEELIDDTGEVPQSADGHERTLVGNILRLRDRNASHAMVPRADIVAVPITAEVDELMAILAEQPHSRLPVYRDGLDDPVGTVHIKDVIKRLAKSEPVHLPELVRPVPIIAPSVPVLDLLLELRLKRHTMALVVDEFGGIDGLITIEDLVEEIVGEIADEHDPLEAPQLVRQEDGSFLIDARLEMEQFEDTFGPLLTAEEREDIDTVGGLVYSIEGRVPARGELIQHPAGWEFEIADADARRMRRLRMRRSTAAAVAPPNAKSAR